jgi:hypothetical protein
MGPVGIYLIFGTNGVQRGGMYIKPAEWPAPPNWLPYGAVRSVDDSAAEFEGEGAKILNPPMEVPGGSRIVSFVDPAGAAFALNSFAAAAAAAPASKPEAKPKAKVKAKQKAIPKVKAKAAAKKAPVKKKAAKKVAKKAGKKAAPKKAKARTKVKVKAKKSKSARRKK